MDDEPVPDGEPRPTVGVGAVCVRAGRLLLVRRRADPGAGTWAVPGGRLEPGEALAAGVARELAEETGLHGVVGDLVGVAERIGPGHHYVILDYRVAVPEDAVAVAGDDADDVTWADRATLAALPLVDGLADWLAAHGVIDELT